MGNQDDAVSRRKFLEQAGATVGAVALGACSSNDEPDATGAVDEPAAGSGGTGTSPAVTGGAPGSGAVATQSAAGSGGRGGSGGTGGAASPAANSGGAGAAAGSGGEVASGGAGAPSAAGAPATAPSGKVVVGIVASRDNLDEAVARAVELAGGLGAIQPGQTVFIKPNAVSDRLVGTPGIRTSPEVLAAVVRLVRTKNPGKIIVGDRSARQFPDTAGVFERSGLRQAALDAGADEVYAAKSPEEAPDEWMLLQPPKYEGTWSSAGGLLAMRRILEADHLINVPTCKNHRYALFSLSMKNFMGAIGDATRDPVHFLDTASGNFGAIASDLAVLNQMFKPLMNIIDATTALVNGGPQGDGADAVRASPGLIFASSDRIAVDAAAVSLIQLELETAMVPQPDAANPVLKSTIAWKLPQILAAIERGIGVTGPDAVELAFDGVMTSAAIEANFRKV